ncbi:hypothetical protein JTE90_023202 [Oedothorax gibbosus]|uniref:Uncharacterized protein n=1 Tax=Oedothorax gibbosus TaxID=931172 RepID=A0AAV6VJM1_9ARAC|nr:hypothetical protein JTE90_023202 [Oedothorax gibbosus]
MCLSVSEAQFHQRVSVNPLKSTMESKTKREQNVQKTEIYFGHAPAGLVWFLLTITGPSGVGENGGKVGHIKVSDRSISCRDVTAARAVPGRSLPFSQFRERIPTG